MIGKVFSHVEHKMILGFKGLFLGAQGGQPYGKAYQGV